MRLIATDGETTVEDSIARLHSHLIRDMPDETEIEIPASITTLRCVVEYWIHGTHSYMTIQEWIALARAASFLLCDDLIDLTMNKIAVVAANANTPLVVRPCPPVTTQPPPLPRAPVFQTAPCRRDRDIRPAMYEGNWKRVEELAAAGQEICEWWERIEVGCRMPPSTAAALYAAHRPPHHVFVAVLERCEHPETRHWAVETARKILIDHATNATSLHSLRSSPFMPPNLKRLRFNVDTVTLTELIALDADSYVTAKEACDAIEAALKSYVRIPTDVIAWLATATRDKLDFERSARSMGRPLCCAMNARAFASVWPNIKPAMALTPVRLGHAITFNVLLAHFEAGWMNADEMLQEYMRSMPPIDATAADTKDIVQRINSIVAYGADANYKYREWCALDIYLNYRLDRFGEIPALLAALTDVPNKRRIPFEMDEQLRDLTRSDLRRRRVMQEMDRLQAQDLALEVAERVDKMPLRRFPTDHIVATRVKLERVMT